ncbi:MAG: hypothetical protein ACLS76_15745, partial [Eubacterium callanderi]
PRIPLHLNPPHHPRGHPGPGHSQSPTPAARSLVEMMIKTTGKVPRLYELNLNEGLELQCQNDIPINREVLETARLSTLLQAYWHLLMYYNNKAAQKGVSPAAVTKAYKRALLAMRKKAA